MKHKNFIAWFIVCCLATLTIESTIVFIDWIVEKNLSNSIQVMPKPEKEDTESIDSVDAEGNIYTVTEDSVIENEPY